MLITYCCNTSYSYVLQRMQEQNYKNILVKEIRLRGQINGNTEVIIDEL